MDLKQIGIELAKIGLPLLGAALPIPGGAAMATALASHLGVSNPKEIVQAIAQTPELLQRAREFEATHQEKLLTITLEAEKAANQATVDDRESARNLKIKTGSTMPEQLTYIFVLAFLALMVGLLAGWLSLPEEPHTFTIITMGITLIIREVTQTCGYWVSSTFQSKSKDETIKNLSEE